MVTNLVSLIKETKKIEIIVDTFIVIKIMTSIEDLICPITQNIMTDPVFDDNGHTFERIAITEWYSTSNMSPITHTSVTSKKLTPNILLKRQILEYHESMTNNTSVNNTPSIVPEKLSHSSTNINVTFQETDKQLCVQLDTTENKTKVPQHIVLLVDKSGSMASKVTVKDDTNSEVDYGLSLLDVVKQSIKTLLKILLEDTDNTYYLTLITFNSFAERECSHMLVNTSNLLYLTNVVDKIKASSTTNIWDAFRLGIDTIKQLQQVENHRLIMFTDGVPNIHPFSTYARQNEYTSEAYLRSISSYLTSQNVQCQFNTIGFGRGKSLDSELLLDIANNFGGIFAFISDISMLASTWLYIIANIIHQTSVINPIISYKTDGIHHEKILNRLTDNQLKLVFLPKKSTDIKLTYYECDSTYRESAAQCAENEIKNIFPEKCREQLCETLKTVINYLTINQKDSAQTELTQFCQMIKDNIYKNKSIFNITESVDDTLQGYLDDILTSGKAHDGGQISMAISSQSFYQDWGGHYLRSIYNAHRIKCKSNFKDKGLNYETPEIKNHLAKMEGIYLGMSPPKPSRQTATTRVIKSNNTLYQRGGGCYSGDSQIKTPSGFITAKSLKKGDILTTPRGSTTIICVIRIKQPNEECQMCQLGNSYLTPYHPIYVNNKWCFPATCLETLTLPLKYVYNFILADSHQIYLGETLTPTFGHNLTGDIIEHPYFGNSKIIKDFQQFNGFTKGLIDIKSDDFTRDVSSQCVNGINASE